MLQVGVAQFEEASHLDGSGRIVLTEDACPDLDGIGDRNGPGVAGRGRVGFRAVGGVADLLVGKGAGEGDLEGVAERSVAVGEDHFAGGELLLAAVSLSRSGGGEVGLVAEGDIGHPDGAELGPDEEVVVVGGRVHEVEGKDILSDPQPVEVAVERDCLEVEGLGVGPVTQGDGIETKGAGRVQRSDPHAVEVGNHGIVILQVKREADDVVATIKVKRNPDIDGGALVEGNLLKIRVDQVAVADAAIVTGSKEACGPQVVVEGDLGPADPEVVVGGDMGGAGGIHVDQDILRGDRFLFHAVGGIVELGRIGGRELMDDGSSVRSDEGQVFAAVLELETGVELLAGHRPVLARGEEEKELPLLEDDTIGDAPLGKVFRAISEKVATEVNRIRIGVVEFQPVLPVTVLVPLTRLVVGEDFGNDGGGGGGEGSCQQEQAEKESLCGMGF